MSSNATPLIITTTESESEHVGVTVPSIFDVISDAISTFSNNQPIATIALGRLRSVACSSDWVADALATVGRPDLDDEQAARAFDSVLTHYCVGVRQSRTLLRRFHGHCGHGGSYAFVFAVCVHLLSTERGHPGCAPARAFLGLTSTPDYISPHPTSPTPAESLTEPTPVGDHVPSPDPERVTASLPDVPPVVWDYNSMLTAMVESFINNTVQVNKISPSPTIYDSWGPSLYSLIPTLLHKDVNCTLKDLDPSKVGPKQVDRVTQIYSSAIRAAVHKNRDAYPRTMVHQCAISFRTLAGKRNERVANKDRV